MHPTYPPIPHPIPFIPLLRQTNPGALPHRLNLPTVQKKDPMIHRVQQNQAHPPPPPPPSHRATRPPVNPQQPLPNQYVESIDPILLPHPTIGRPTTKQSIP
jgi:hypothetical protein